MVIALGLIMILLGAVSMTTANEENITAISQNSRSDALAIAEVGVARYRESLDRNRRLAINDSGQWGTLTGICNNNTNEAAPVTADDYFPSLTPNVANTIALAEDGQILNNDGDNTDSFNIGSYSLVSYDYSNANDVFNSTNDTTNNNARGILTVKGTAPDGSEAQIEAEIPVRINLRDMETIAPALWVGSTTPTLGNLTIGNGNVVIKDSATAAADGCNGFSALASTTPRRPVISDSRDLPPITKITTDKNAAKTLLTTERAAATPAKANPNTINPLPAVSSGQMIFGTTSHDPFNPDANNTNCSNIKLCRYYYEFGSTTSDLTSDPTLSALTSTVQDTDLLTDGVARTTLVLNQSLTINAASRNIKIGSTSPVANDSNTFEIYVNDNDNDPTNVSSNNITINATGGNVTINGFIHAPQSTLTITGTGTVNINGSVWVKNFVNSASSVTISPDLITRVATTDDSSTSGRGYRFYSTTASRTPRPITGSPTNWKTEQVN
jgi:hypothetical protein